MHEFRIIIDVVKGGFVVEYPVEVKSTDKAGFNHYVHHREVFVSPRKLNQKIKDVVESLSTTPSDD